MRWSFISALALTTSCATPTVTRVRLEDLPRATPAVVYALPKSIVRVRGALTKKDVVEPRCNDLTFMATLGLERETPAREWSVSELDVDTYAVTDFDQLYAIEDGSTAFVTRKLSLQLNDAFALTHARTESTNVAVEFAKGVFRVGTDIAAAALSMNPAAVVPKLRGSEEEQAKQLLCQSSAQSLAQVRLARLELLKGGADKESRGQADDKLAALERSLAQVFTGVAKVTRVPFECRVDPAELTFTGARPLDVALVSVDVKAGKLIAVAGRECVATAEAWSPTAASATPITLRVAPNFVSTAAQRVAPAGGGLVYRLPANAELSLAVGAEARVRTSRALPQLGIVLTLPPSSLSGTMDVDLDPATGALHKFETTRAASVTDVPTLAGTFGDAVTAVKKARTGSLQEEVDTLDLELKRLKKANELRDERAKAEDAVRE